MPDAVQRIGDLEVAQDHDFQRMNWALQRYMWIGMAVIVLLGLLGLFGSGPLSGATAGEHGAPLQLRYERFGRLQSSCVLEAELRPGAGSGHEARLWFDRLYLNSVLIEQVEPPPLRVEASNNGATYVFDLAEPGQPAHVEFRTKLERLGLIRGRAAFNGGTPLEFGQIIYP